MRQERKVQVWKRDNYVCYYCGKRNLQRPTIDHVVPVSKGGSSEFFNLVTACYSCNNAKGDLLPTDGGTCIVKRAWQVPEFFKRKTPLAWGSKGGLD